MNEQDRNAQTGAASGRAGSARARNGHTETASHLAVTAWESMFRAQSQLFRGFSESPVWQGRSQREYDVLYQLSREAEETGVCQRDLGERLLISQPSLSRLIDRLVAEGLVDRRPDPRDGRVALLTLSTEGLALQRRIGAAHAADIAQAMRAKLNDTELIALRELTSKLVRETATPDRHDEGEEDA